MCVCVCVWQGSLTKVVAHAAPSSMFLTCSSHTVMLFDQRSPAQAVLQCPSRGGHKLHSLALHPFQTTSFVTGDAAGSVSFWDLRLLDNGQYDSCETRSAALGAQQPGNIIWDVVYMPESADALFTASNAGALDLWLKSRNPAVPPFELALRLEEGHLPLMALDVHPKTKALCAASEMSTLQLYARVPLVSEAMVA